MGLGSRDPRNRRDAQARQSDSIVSAPGGTALDGQGKIVVDFDKIDAELQRRGFKKDGA
jgi:hypothetical protein